MKKRQLNKESFYKYIELAFYVNLITGIESIKYVDIECKFSAG